MKERQIKVEGRFLNLPFAKEGVRFSLPLLVATGVFFLFGCVITGSILLILTVFVIAFFRDPERDIPDIDNAIISPADGKVVEIKEVSDDPVYNQDSVRISIFLNIFNVHVNRAPIGGKILKIVYNKGKFLNAANEKASLDNEQNSVLIETKNGTQVLVKQIAGLIARRIVCWRKEGNLLKTGERYGLIRFGSRTDIFLPKGTDINVNIGDKVKGGINVIAKIK